MLETIGIAKSGKYVLQGPNKELLARWLVDCENSFIKARWTKVGHPKTHKQCKVHFGLAIAKIREAMIDKGWGICGIAPNVQMIHEILTKMCGGVGPLGSMKRFSEMTTTEASKFFENIRDWSAHELHIVIPDPSPTWREDAKQKRNMETD